MNLLNFSSTFPDEASCKAKWKELRDNQGVVCQNADAKNITGKPTKNVTNAKNANTAGVCAQTQ